MPRPAELVPAANHANAVALVSASPEMKAALPTVGEEPQPAGGGHTRPHRPSSEDAALPVHPVDLRRAA
jgi:hypothetical protein